MNTMKTLMLAAATVLSLGAGAAMAQGEMPSAGEGAYFSQQHRPAARQATNNASDQVQSGSSDAAPTDSLHSIPGWRDLPNYTDPG
jgi:hypothetical protein